LKKSELQLEKYQGKNWGSAFIGERLEEPHVWNHTAHRLKDIDRGFDLIQQILSV